MKKKKKKKGQAKSTYGKTRKGYHTNNENR
jgi:hypothetical protein